jgi:DNA topoisomerase-1
VIGGVGRFGPYLKYKGKFHSVQKGTDLLAMTEQEALDLLKAALSAPQFPLEIGEYEGEQLSVNKGRFGPYIKFGSAFVSIPRGTDPTTVDRAQAIALIEAKKDNDKNNILRTFPENEELQIVKGRYGPYISYKKKNIALPKDADMEKLSLAELLAIVEKAGDKAPTKKAASKAPRSRKK